VSERERERERERKGKRKGNIIQATSLSKSIITYEFHRNKQSILITHVFSKTSYCLVNKIFQFLLQINPTRHSLCNEGSKSRYIHESCKPRQSLNVDE